MRLPTTGLELERYFLQILYCYSKLDSKQSYTDGQSTHMLAGYLAAKGKKIHSVVENSFAAPLYTER